MARRRIGQEALALPGAGRAGRSSTLDQLGDHEEVCGPCDGIGAGTILLAGAPTFEAIEACR